MPAEPAPSRDLRRVRFGTFVARLLDAAQARGMTVEQIEQATGIGNSTFYRWRDGKWTRDPLPSSVRAFTKGLGGSLAEANAALAWSDPHDGKTRAPEPLIEDPDLRALMRKLSDPNTPAAEKLWIRRQIRALAGMLDQAE